MYDEFAPHDEEHIDHLSDVSENLRHSGLGITSFIMSILVGFLLFIIIVIAGVVEATTPGGMDEESIIAIIVGLSLFGLIGLDLIAFVLGMIGLFQKQRKKIFAILGTIFSGLAVLGTIGLITIGLVAENMQ